MSTRSSQNPTQSIGTTIMVVMMDVDPEHDEEFNRWYNDEHLPERLEIPGYVSARRFKLEEGQGVLKYLCIWELEDPSPMQSRQYQEQNARSSQLRDRAHSHIRERMRGLYQQIYPAVGAFEDHSGFRPEGAQR